MQPFIFDVVVISITLRNSHIPGSNFTKQQGAPSSDLSEKLSKLSGFWLQESSPVPSRILFEKLTF